MRGTRSAVARLLQERRERAGFSRAELGRRLEISPGTIEGWELGRVERPPLHDVIRLAAFLRISYDDLLAVVTEDSGGIPRQPDGSVVARKARPKKTLGPIPLLEASFRLFRWKDEADAAAALKANPEQVRLWRRGVEPMSVVDYLSLAAVVSVGIAEAIRSPDTTDFDLRGAAGTLGLSVGEI